MSKAVDEQAQQAIVEYMIAQNRPYSAIDVFNNLHKVHGKTLVVKCLESAAQQGSLIEKLVSKQKIYFANQANFPEFDEAELKRLDESIAERSQQQKNVQTDLKTVESELRSWNAAKTTDELLQEKDQLLKQVLSLEKRLSALEAAGGQVDPAEKRRVEARMTTAVREWRRRKRMADGVIGMVMESWPKKKKDLLEEVGVETDEEHGVAMPTGC